MNSPIDSESQINNAFKFIDLQSSQIKDPLFHFLDESTEIKHSSHTTDFIRAPIAAKSRGNASRSIASLQFESLPLRYSLKEKDILIADYQRQLHSQDIVIKQLQLQLSDAKQKKIRDVSGEDKVMHSLASSNSTLFQSNDSSEASFTDTGFYSHSLSKSFPLLLGFTPLLDLPRPGSPDWSLNIKANPSKCKVDWTDFKGLSKPVEACYRPFLDVESNSVDPQFIDSQLNATPVFISDEHATLKISFKSLVDKIVKTNDQSCSIFLQQRLKVESPVVKSLIFDAIMIQILVLIKNRFGNFLVQCCLDYINNEQMEILTQKISCYFVPLCCDRFGCHVMQKVIGIVDEQSKLVLINELLKKISDTFTDKFACHVWQRIFEIRWQNGDPGIMNSVQLAMTGSWCAIANNENGSLVVQCLFEQTSKRHRKLIIDEIFERTAEIAQGQWGNWVMQHLLEHGSIAEQTHIIDVIFKNPFEMSNDQYTSKVVEKCIKIASASVLIRFIDSIITYQPSLGSPFILVMMNDQYGNYVVQNILTVAGSIERDKCANLIAPHIYSLRNSKYGQRVASLCEKNIRSNLHKSIPHNER